MNEETIKRAEEWLKERWQMVGDGEENPCNGAFYRGAVAMLEKLGLDWLRREDGTHAIFTD